MADNFLERQRADYEKRKEEWMKKKIRLSVARKNLMVSHDTTLYSFAIICLDELCVELLTIRYMRVYVPDR